MSLAKDARRIRRQLRALREGRRVRNRTYHRAVARMTARKEKRA